MSNSENFNLPPYEEWKRQVECENEWRTYRGQRAVWKIGRITVVDKNGHAINHCGYELLKEVLKKLDFGDRTEGLHIAQAVEFDHPVGYNECVITTENDRVVYLQRHQRANVTRFALDRVPEPCNTVYVILDQIGDTDRFIFRTAYVGIKSGREPWDSFATAEDVEFWKTHALVAPADADESDDLGDSTYWRKGAR